MNPTTYGLDIAKKVMQVHWVDSDSGEIGRRTLKRSQWCRSLPAKRRRGWCWRRVAAGTTGVGRCPGSAIRCG